MNRPSSSSLNRLCLCLLTLLFALLTLNPSLGKAQHLNTTLEITSVADEVFAIKTEPSVEELRLFDSLSEEQRQKFFDTRKWFLNAFAKMLWNTRGAIGSGLFVKDQVNFMASKVTGKEVETGVLKERLREFVQSSIEAIDRRLWSQSPLVVRSNEMGFVFLVGGILEGGVGSKGWGGAVDIGISVGFDREKKAFVFEIFRTTEKFTAALPTAFVTGLYGKAGFFIADSHGKPGVKNSTTFYPPAMPGYAQAGKDYFSSGLSSNLGFPPPPFADFLSYSNQSERSSLIRISVSPVVKGYIRLQLGVVPKFVKVGFVSIEKAIHDFRKKMGLYGSSQVMSCSRVF
jgi:hypothetical protein